MVTIDPRVCRKGAVIKTYDNVILARLTNGGTGRLRWEIVIPFTGMKTFDTGMIEITNLVDLHITKGALQ